MIYKYMPYNVIKDFLWDNCFFIETESGNKYCIKLNETDNNSGVWIVNFILLQGFPQNKEVFKTLNLFWNNLKQFMIDRNITSVFGWIDGKDREEIDQKTKVFTRWVDYPFICEVDDMPEIRIQGKSGAIYPNTNFFHIKRREDYTPVVEVEKKSEETHLEDKDKTSFKFCPDCGTENKSFKFCPNCGKKLNQE